MSSGFASQLLFGNREWSILDEAYGARPINNPVQVSMYNQNEVTSTNVNSTERIPSETDNQLIDGSNVIGYMADDEDIQQAQYNVMNMIDNRLTELSNEINSKLDLSLNGRFEDVKSKIQELTANIETNKNNITGAYQDISDLETINEEELEVISNLSLIHI